VTKTATHRGIEGTFRYEPDVGEERTRETIDGAIAANAHLKDQGYGGPCGLFPGWTGFLGTLCALRDSLKASDLDVMEGGIIAPPCTTAHGLLPLTA
jgi:hypothetical protein